MPHNQNAIAASLFAPPFGPPLSTRVTVAGIEVLVPAPTTPQTNRKGEEWVDMTTLAEQKEGVKGFFGQLQGHSHYAQCTTWIVAQLNLAAVVCMGQNYMSIHLVESCHTWKEAFKALVHSSLSLELSS